MSTTTTKEKKTSTKGVEFNNVKQSCILTPEDTCKIMDEVKDAIELSSTSESPHAQRYREICKTEINKLENLTMNTTATKEKKTSTQRVKRHLEKLKLGGVKQSCIYTNEETREIMQKVKEALELGSISEAFEHIAKKYAGTIEYQKIDLGLHKKEAE